MSRETGHVPTVRLAHVYDRIIPFPPHQTIQLTPGYRGGIRNCRLLGCTIKYASNVMLGKFSKVGSTEIMSMRLGHGFVKA